MVSENLLSSSLDVAQLLMNSKFIGFVFDIASCMAPIGKDSSAGVDDGTFTLDLICTGHPKPLEKSKIAENNLTLSRDFCYNVP